MDFSESDEDEPNEDELGTLPLGAIHALQNVSLKRSLMETLDQAQDQG